MTWTWEAIYTAMTMRRTADAERFRRMIDVRDRANGDIVIPLPDVDGEPTLEPPSPRLILDAIDSTAMQAGSVMPSIFCPSLDPTKTDGIRSAAYAATRRRALYSNWYWNALDVKLLRYYRHLVGYGTGCLMVLPDFESKRASIELRDPLSVYPEPRSPDDVREPLNLGCVFGRSRTWILANYRDKQAVVDWLSRSNEDLWDVVEWIDENDIVIGLLGPRYTASNYIGLPRTSQSYPNGLELRRWPNRAGMVPVATPRRVTLDKIMGQVDTIIGSVDLLTRMAALEVVAAEKAVFPDLQVQGNGGRPPQLLNESNEWYDGRTGKANVILDGQASYLVSSVGPATFQTMANLERNIRLSSGNSALNQGEFTGSIRSGATANALAGMSINPRTQEIHLIAQRSLSVVNSAILATEKGYWPDKKYVCFGGHPGDSMVEYVPSTHFETYENAVLFPFPGMDLSQVTVAVAQMNASGLISRTTARQQHPLIVDADAEEKRVLVERVDEAALMGFLQMMQQAPDPEFYIELRKHLERGMALGPAVEAARKTIADEQAQQQPPSPVGPGAAGGAPSWAPQPGPANTPGVNTDQVKVRQLMQALRSAPSTTPVGQTA